MAAWAGFSDEDLRKVKNLASTSHQKAPRGGADKPKKASFGRDKGPPRRQEPTTSTKHSDIDPSMKLQKESQESAKGSHKIPKGNNEGNPTDKEESPSTTSKDISNTNHEMEPEEKVSELDDKEALERDMKSLEKFQNQQKMIEEANKQKKALLAKTLTERKKLAQKEAHKLEHIQKELSKLDSLLTADVQVIRNKIEDASREFLDAQRRFERAEAEYVASKVDLHSKSELKEHLTEHLYTIIHQNEVRKAKKLADLMKELEMDNSEEEFILPELPPLSSFQPASTSLSPTGSAAKVSFAADPVVHSEVIMSQSSDSSEHKHPVSPSTESNTEDKQTVAAQSTYSNAQSTYSNAQSTNSNAQSTNSNAQSTDSNELKQTGDSENKNTLTDGVSQKSESKESVPKENPTNDLHSDMPQNSHDTKEFKPGEVDKLSISDTVNGVQKSKEENSPSEMNHRDKNDSNSVIKTCDTPNNVQSNPTLKTENDKSGEVIEEISNETKLPDSWNFNPLKT